MKLERPIVVLGAGPAGVATALGLQRLGYMVTVVSVPRPFDAIEGVSNRVVAGLQSVGIRLALDAILDPSPRQAEWADKQTAVNHERLVDRTLFDTLLWTELPSHGIERWAARVTRWKRTSGGHELVLQPADGSPAMVVHAGFVVEARGRQAPHPPEGVLRGPETVALLCHSRGVAGGPPGSAVVSLEDGWAWMARLPSGVTSWQWTIDPDATRLRPRANLTQWVLDRLAPIALARGFGVQAEAAWCIRARTSTAWMVPEVCGDDWIRVGDAAMAADPLSGNGIFQSLSSALQAPIVVHTLLRHPDDAAVARRFHQERVAGLFDRFARIGRDFYAQESRWPESPFWAKRRSWPDTLPANAPNGAAKPQVAWRPVIDRDRIRLAEVVVTEAQPLGVWHVDGMLAADAWRAVQKASDAPAAIAEVCRCSLSRAQRLLEWMRAQGWLPLP